MTLESDYPEIAAVLAGESDGCIVCGDCLEVMAAMSDGCVDAVVTDPPYGIRFVSHGHCFRTARPIAGDDSTRLAMACRTWSEARGIRLCMFFSPYQPMRGFRSVLVWAKGAHVGIGGDRATCWKRDFEMIGIERNAPLNGPRDSAVLQVPALLPPPTGHPAEKPVVLMEYLVSKLTDVNEIILDPFCGSGTTCVAAKKLGRRWIGIEIDEKYCEIARRRVAGTPKPLFSAETAPKGKGAMLFDETT